MWRYPGSATSEGTPTPPPPPPGALFPGRAFSGDFVGGSPLGSAYSAGGGATPPGEPLFPDIDQQLRELGIGRLGAQPPDQFAPPPRQSNSIAELFGLPPDPQSQQMLFSYSPGPAFAMQGEDYARPQPPKFQPLEVAQRPPMPVAEPKKKPREKSPPAKHQQAERALQTVPDAPLMAQPVWTPPGPRIEPCDADGVHVPFDPEIVYITDADGNFLSVEDHSWNKFLTFNTNDPALPFTDSTVELRSDTVVDLAAIPNNLQQSAFPNILKRNLFAFLPSPPLAHFTRRILDMVLTSGRPMRYKWFCDSPGHERKMEMRVARLRGLEGVEGVVWTSKIVWERPHPGIGVGYLKRKAIEEPDERELDVGRELGTLGIEAGRSPEMIDDGSVGSPQSGLEVVQSGLNGSGSPPPAQGQLTAVCAADADISTVCSFCKRILLPLALVSAANMPRLLHSLAQHNKIPLPMPTEPSPDSPAPVPVIGLRGKRGHHVFSKPPTAQTSAWVTPWEYYVLAGQADGDEKRVRHGVCGGCWEEMCGVVGMPSWIEKGKRLWGGE
ncbi:hypothetical protein DFJ74DRAFT_664367 [Hyaloraphidium curvatum]|nr:hypothetical protein DFJ74DRAFT_664367 [Hyaloraphidium curvatum]